ncbi:MAG: flagellar basal body-associated FliL family protein [Azoarcus sp.]|jgi:flagellar FliL protein|nr:flagellar basal body-associated FliL family protein [Azoarcus sp.]
MAQAAPPAKQDAAAATPAPKRSAKLLLIIVLVAVFVLLIAVLGVAALMVMKKNSGKHDTATPPPIPEASVFNLNKPPVFAQIDPFTVDLRGENGEESHYLQTVIALRVADQHTADALKGWMPEIRHRINIILSSKRPEDIQSSASREALANEIQEQVNTLLGAPPPPPGSLLTAQPPIQAVLFNSFIIQ